MNIINRKSGHLYLINSLSYHGLFASSFTLMLRLSGRRFPAIVLSIVVASYSDSPS